MIINPEQYKRGRGGGIKTTERVFISCDECGKEWGTQYSNYKKKNQAPRTVNHSSSVF